MTFCGPALEAFSSGTWENIDSPSSVTVSYISGWYLQTGNLSKLNNAITIDTWVSGGACIAGIDADAIAIYEMIYRTQFFQRKQASLAVSVAAGDPTVFWTNLREGDSSVSRPSIVEAQKALNAIIAQNSEELRTAVQDYKRKNTPLGSVDFASLHSWPTP